MTRFKVDNLTSRTSEEDQRKLVAALRSVFGVQSATVDAASSVFEIKAWDSREPSRDDITAAAAKVGFLVSSEQ